MAKVSTKDIAKAIYGSAKDKSGADLEHSLKNSVEFLAKKNLFGKAPEIIKHLEQIINADLNIVSAKAISKEALSKHATNEIKHALKKHYKAKDIILELQEDKTLLGGIRIETESEVLDLSLKNKLNQLQTYLINN